jgi:hypothetical protein
VENYEEKEKIVKVEDIGVDDAGSTRFHNMLLDLVQYNNIDRKIYIHFEGIYLTMYIPSTNFEGIHEYFEIHFEKNLEKPFGLL